MSEIIYMQLRETLPVQSSRTIHLKDIAQVVTTSSLKEKVENVKVYRMSKTDQKVVVIDGLRIIEHLQDQFPSLTFKLIGQTKTILKMKDENKKRSLLLVLFVWFLLFIGAAMTIMNFHYDVSMQEVQEKLHYFITGEENKQPLLIQIPYSLGLGVGMLLFLNHWFHKKFNEEPSPLEIELFNYQKNLNEYIRHDYKRDD